MKATRTVVSIVVLVAVGWCSTAAWGDPLPGRDILKFQQKPLNGLTFTGSDGNTVSYWGHDESSTAYWDGIDPTVRTYNGTYMADDFADTADTPVVHVKWWGSYIKQATPNDVVRRFLIAFEEDIPGDAATPSRPGAVLQTQVVTFGPLSPSSGTFTETLVPGPPAGVEQLYEYNAELACEFPQKPDTVYWLKIVALVDNVDPATGAVPLDWGWHNRDYSVMDPAASIAPNVVPGEADVSLATDPSVWHFQDDAVAGFVNAVTPFNPDCNEPQVVQDNWDPQKYIPGLDGPQWIGNYSKDLAFELYTVPEPASILVMSAAGLAALLKRRRKS